MSSHNQSTQSNNNNTNSSNASGNSNNASTAQSSTSTQSSTFQNASQLPDVDQTAMCEYLEMIQSEYSIERGKKESFENRAGIIMALIGALLVFILDKLPVTDVIKLCRDPLTFVVLMKIIVGFSAYIALILALFFLFLTITTSKQENYPIEQISFAYLAEVRKEAIARIIINYRDIIVKHREHNEKRAFKYKTSLVLSFVSIGCFITFFIIK